MNLSFWQALFLGLLQGVTELFPISSLGHTVIIPELLGWGDLVRNEKFLPLITALHLGTAVALVIYFRRDWAQVVRTVFVSIRDGEIRPNSDEWVYWLVLIGCIPAGLLGVFLETPLKKLFATPLVAASFLIVNGFILFFGERLRRRAEGVKAQLPAKIREAESRPLSSLTWKEAILVGLAQSLALIPGISRSGSTIVAGLGVRLNHEDAARFSFLLGTPLIAAAGLLEVPQLLGISSATMLLVGIAIVAAAVAAYLSTKYMLKYFETGRLIPFAYYCWGLGGIALVLILLNIHL
jgi:undecaprenyl-diphosphatase